MGRVIARKWFSVLLYLTTLIITFDRCLGMMKTMYCLIVLLNAACIKHNAHTMDQNNISEKHKYYSRTDTSMLDVTDEEWKEILPEDVYYIGRKAGTERAFTGKYWDFVGTGTYYCAVCGNALFRSDAKFASSCGWPSFFEALRTSSVIYKIDKSHGMIRTEVNCGRCNSHLGHIFDDGPPPTGKRFCMNSIVLDFEPDKGNSRHE